MVASITDNCSNYPSRFGAGVECTETNSRQRSAAVPPSCGPLSTQADQTSPSVLATSPSLSRFPARYYTYIFITCDLISLVLQAAGGGTAATADGNMSQLDVGDHMMMAGLAFQVFTSSSSAHYRSSSPSARGARTTTYPAC